MLTKTPIVIVLNRAFDLNDEKAIDMVIAKWLVFDVKVQRRRSRTEIQFFHTDGAKPDLVRELSELFPGEHSTAM